MNAFTCGVSGSRLKDTENLSVIVGENQFTPRLFGTPNYLLELCRGVVLLPLCYCRLLFVLVLMCYLKFTK